MDTLMRDIRFAIRSLATSKLFTTVAVLMLAVGIGVNTAVFSLVDAAVFKPLPFRNAKELVGVSEWSATKLCAFCGVGTSYPGFLDWRQRTHSFTSLGAYTELAVAISGSESAERVGAAIVSFDLFPTLGVSPALGRGIRAEEDRVGGERVVLLGDDLWRRRYQGDSAILGRTIRVNGVSYTVVGVMPPRFKFPEFAELWLPLAHFAYSAPRSARNYDVVARLRPGVRLAQADAEMRTLAQALAKEYPGDQSEWTAQASAFRRDYAGETAQLWVVMLGAVTFVLLIVCANVAGLLLARGHGRQREFAIRTALGASRVQIVRQLLAESVLLALIGGVLGTLLSMWVVDFTVASVGSQVPFWLDFGIDARALAFCIFISLATGVAFGLLPALRASRPDVHVTLKQGGQTLTGGSGRSRLRSGLVVVELGLALVLLAGAGLLIKSFLSVRPQKSFDTSRILTANVEFLDDRYADRSQVLNVSFQVLERLGAVAQIERVALRRFDFLRGFGARANGITAEGVREVPEGVSPSFTTAVTPAYFGIVEDRLTQGRTFAAEDRSGTPLVAVINAQLARQLWPGSDPLGKRLKLGAADSLPWLTVVGVLADARGERGVRNSVYVPFAQHPGRPATLLVRTGAQAEPLQVVPDVRAVVRTLDADLPLVGLKTMQQEDHDQYWPFEMIALFMSGFAILAILLAAVGLYGVIAFAASHRTREIGIRMALGANEKDVLLLVTGEGLRLVVAGVVIGIGGAVALLRVLRSMLFGVSPVDPIVYVLVTVLLALVTLLASYLPARRATRVDPLVALRSE
jgi:putative ABC transport system permease protein